MKVKCFGLGVMAGAALQVPVVFMLYPDGGALASWLLGLAILGYSLYRGAHLLLVKPYLF